MPAAVYWALVGCLTVGFAVADLLALSRRELGRKQGFAIGVYLTAWGLAAVLGLPIAPLGSIWWVFPAAIRIGFAVIVGVGSLLAEGGRLEQSVEHRHDPKPPPNPAHVLTANELHDVELYESLWRARQRPDPGHDVEHLVADARDHEREAEEQGRSLERPS